MNKKLSVLIDVNTKTGDIKVLNKELDKLNEHTDTASDNIERLKSTLLGISASSIAALASSFSFLKDSISIAGEFERFGSILETIEGSAKKAKESLKWVNDFAKTTPYELKEVTEAFVQMKSYGLKPLGDGLKTLGDTAAAMGKPLMQAVEALADAVTGENERLKEFGIRASKVGEKIKYTWTSASGKTKEIVIKNNRKIIESTLKAIFNSKYAGAMDRLSKTWIGLTSNLSDSWTNFKQELAIKSGIFDSAKRAITSLNSYFSKLLNNKDKMKSLANSVTTFARVTIEAFRAIAKGGTYLTQGFYTIKYAFDKVLNDLSVGWAWLKKKFYELIDTLTSWLPKQPSWAIDIKKSLASLNIEYNNTVLKGAELDQALIENSKNFDSLRDFIDKTADIMKEGAQTADKTKDSNKNLANKTKEAAEAYLKAHGAIDQTSASLSNQKEKIKEATKAWHKHLEEIYKAQDKNLDKYTTFLEDMGRKEEAWQIKKKKLIEEYRDTLTDDELKAYIDLKKKEYLEEQKHLNKVKDLWKDVYKNLKGEIKDTFSNFLIDGGSLKGAFRNILDDIKKSLISPFANEISKSFSKAILDSIGLTKEGLSGSGLLGSLKKLFTGNFKGFGGDIKDYGKNLFGDLKKAGSGLFSGLSSLFSGSSGGILNSLGSIGSAIGSITSLIAPIGGLVSGVSAIIKGLKGTKRLDQVGVEVRDGLINIAQGIDALENKIVKYEIYKKSSWAGTKTSLRDYMLPKEWESSINKLLKAYDTIAKSLNKFGEIKLKIDPRNYKFDEFVNEIGLSFVEAISSARIDKSKIRKAWEDYAAQIGKTINEAIIGKLSEIGTIKQSISKAFSEITAVFDEKSWLTKLKKSTEEAKKAFWNLAQSIEGGKGVNLKNFSDRLNKAISKSLTPETIDNWKRLGTALKDAALQSEKFIDGLKGLINAYTDEIANFERAINSIKGIQTVKVTTQAIEDIFKEFNKAAADTKIEVARKLKEMVEVWRKERIDALKNMGLTGDELKKAIDAVDKKAIAWLEGAKSGLETTQKSLKDLLIEETKKLGQMTGALTALTALEKVKNNISTQTLEQAIKELKIITTQEVKTEKEQNSKLGQINSNISKTAKNTADLKSASMQTKAETQKMASAVSSQTSILSSVENNTANTKSSLFSLKASTDQITTTIRQKIDWNTGVIGSKLDSVKNAITTLQGNNTNISSTIAAWGDAIATTIRQQTNYETGTLGAKLDTIAGKITPFDSSSIVSAINSAKSEIMARLSTRDYTSYLTNISTTVSSWGNAIATTIREQANYIVSTLSSATYSVRDAINAKQISGGGTIDPRPNIDSAKSTLYGIMYSVYSMAAGIKSDLGYTNRLLQQISANTA